MTSHPPADPAAHCRTGLEPEHHEHHHAELHHWRANVGSPIAFDCDRRAPAVLTSIDVLCWNVAIGLGRLPEVLERLRAPAAGSVGCDEARPLVVLVQEAYREDHSVPSSHTGAHHGGQVRVRARASIEDAAALLGMSLRYSPSMRNGAHASDRGNAILANVQLSGARAVLLPHVRQRRVAVTAQIAGHPDITFVCAHLDTRGRLRRAGASARPGSGRAAQAAGLAAQLAHLEGSIVLGGDLNSYLGATDPAVRALVAGGLQPARRLGRWRHTFHTPVRMLLDHVLYRGDRIAAVEVTRLDELPGDRSRSVFGSDHHPLLARVQLRATPPSP